MNSRSTGRDWLGTKEAAAYLGVSPSWLRRHKNEVPPTYIIGGINRYLRSDLDAWIENQRLIPKASKN
jgi:predicted DNA-binding transcriptional regulator AlpA